MKRLVIDLILITILSVGLAFLFLNGLEKEAKLNEIKAYNHCELYSDGGACEYLKNKFID